MVEHIIGLLLLPIVANTLVESINQGIFLLKAGSNVDSKDGEKLLSFTNDSEHESRFQARREQEETSRDNGQ